MGFYNLLLTNSTTLIFFFQSFSVNKRTTIRTAIINTAVAIPTINETDDPLLLSDVSAPMAPETGQLYYSYIILRPCVCVDNPSSVYRPTIMVKRIIQHTLV